MIVRVRDLIRADSEATAEKGWGVVAKLCDTIRALGAKLDANAAVVDTDHLSTIDGILTDTVEE